MFNFKKQNMITKNKNYRTTSEKGRSMVEMLGVIGVIGMLTIGGVAGYQYAMGRYEAHQITDAMTKAKALTATKQIKTDADLILFVERPLGSYQPRVIEGADPVQVDLDKVSERVANHVLNTPNVPYQVRIQEDNPNGLSFIFDGINSLGNKNQCADRCGPGETTNSSSCKAGEVAKATNNTSCGQPCYRCVGNDCPSGTSSFCPSTAEKQPAGETADGTPCYVCLTDDCPTGLSKTCSAGQVAEEAGYTNKGNPCYLCKEDNCPTGQTLSCPAGQTAVEAGSTPLGRPCYTCESDLCPSGTQKSCPDGQIKTEAGSTPSGTPCYTCSSCPSDKPFYNPSSNSCVQCQSNSDCPSDKPICNSAGLCETCPGNQQWDASEQKCECPKGTFWYAVCGYCMTGCQDNNDCDIGEYCWAEARDCGVDCSLDSSYNRQCRSLSADTKRATVDGIEFVGSKVSMNWWSVERFCEAHGLPMTGFEDMQCAHSFNGLDSGYCHKDTSTPVNQYDSNNIPSRVTTLYSKLGQGSCGYWMSLTANACSAYSLEMSRGDVYSGEKSSNLEALCRGSGSSCSGDTPYWSDTLNKCVACRTHDDCSSDAPMCDTPTGTCQPCPEGTSWNTQIKACITAKECRYDTNNLFVVTGRYNNQAPGGTAVQCMNVFKWDGSTVFSNGAFLSYNQAISECGTSMKNYFANGVTAGSYQYTIGTVKTSISANPAQFEICRELK